AARELEPFPLQRGESAQRERDGVDARPQADDQVLTSVVGRRSPDPFDQRRARGSDGDSGKDGTARVANGAANAAGTVLAETRRRGSENPSDGDDHAPVRLHVPSLVCVAIAAGVTLAQGWDARRRLFVLGR